MSLTVSQRIAIANSIVLREALIEAVIRKVNEKNRTAFDELICSSTRYCDANASEPNEWFIEQHYARRYVFDPEVGFAKAVLAI